MLLKSDKQLDQKTIKVDNIDKEPPMLREYIRYQNRYTLIYQDLLSGIDWSTCHLTYLNRLSGKRLLAADINNNGIVDVSDNNLQDQVNEGAITIEQPEFPDYDFYIKAHPKLGYQLKNVDIQSMGKTVNLTPSQLSSGEFTLSQMEDGTWTLTGVMKDQVKVSFHHELIQKPIEPGVDEPQQPTLPSKPDKGLGFVSNGNIVSSGISTGDKTITGLWMLGLSISGVLGLIVIRKVRKHE